MKRILFSVFYSFEFLNFHFNKTVHFQWVTQSTFSPLNKTTSPESFQKVHILQMKDLRCKKRDIINARKSQKPFPSNLEFPFSFLFPNLIDEKQFSIWIFFLFSLLLLSSFPSENSLINRTASQIEIPKTFSHNFSSRFSLIYVNTLEWFLEIKWSGVEKVWWK